MSLDLDDMKEALKQNKSLLLKYLAFQDFRDLSCGSKYRREDVYALSHPGGHPHNWNHLSETTLKTIEDFAKDLTQSSLNNNNSISKSGIPETSTEHKKTDSDDKHKAKPSLLQVLWTKMTTNKPLFAPFLDAGSRLVFAQSQVVIWATEGLSHIIAMSVFEDRYGVVQKKLPLILTSLINLQKTVERHKGLTFTAKHVKKDIREDDVRDQELKQELRTTIKKSIHRIVNTFGDNISAVPLSAEIRSKVEGYKNFMEV